MFSGQQLVPGMTVMTKKIFTGKMIEKLMLVREKHRNRVNGKLTEAIETINFLFDLKFSTYISTEILTRADRVKHADYKGEIHTKAFKKDFYVHSGLTRKQAFYLELDCLGRINECLNGTEKNFPTLVDYNVTNFSITTSFDGYSLDKLNSLVRVDDFESQVSHIVKVLFEAQVSHLDHHTSGKNIVVSEDGILTLIDFDTAQVKEVSFSKAIEDRWHERRFMEGDDIRKIVKNCKFLISSP